MEMTSLKPSWAMRLVEVRHKSGLSQAELAAKIGVSQSAVADWERDRTKPRPDTLRVLDDLLGSNLAEMMWSDVPLRMDERAPLPGRWKIAECPAANREARDALLNTGWEPFAVQGETMWFRRQG